MSVVTFVRDYIQDPDRIVSAPSFVVSACKEFFWYIFSFQWFRNLTYISLSFLNPLASGNGVVPGDVKGINKSFESSTNLTNFLNQNNYSKFHSFLSVDDPLLKEGLSEAHNNLLNTSFEASFNLPDQFSLFQDTLYGFFNGISSTLHFCAVTILVIHVLLNENKNKAFKITLASCFGDISYIGAILFGFRGLVIPWLVLEPLSYVSGFVIQLFFALQIIKDNRKIKTKIISNQTRKASSLVQSLDSRVDQSALAENGALSSHRWILPIIVLFSWCEQTQFFQTGGVLSLQPTSTLLEMSGIVSYVSQSNLGFLKELHSITYLVSFAMARVIFTWFCLSLSQNLIDWFNFRGAARGTSQSQGGNLVFSWPLNIIRNVFYLIKPSTNLTLGQIWAIFVDQIRNYWSSSTKGVTSLFFNIKSWIVPKGLQGTPPRGAMGAQGSPRAYRPAQGDDAYGKGVTIQQRTNSIQHILRDPLSIAAVTCSLAFLPAYSTNLLLTKSVGFFPEENRVAHSFVLPWDMPSTVLASDTNLLTRDTDFAEYPFFLPFYDFGNYNGIGEEDIRYGPFRLWNSRRIRAPWRRTTLQEPALTFANDKSLFINPLFRTPNLSKQNKEETANIITGTNLLPPLIELIKGVWCEAPKPLDVPKGQVGRPPLAPVGYELKQRTPNKGHKSNTLATVIDRTPSLDSLSAPGGTLSGARGTPQQIQTGVASTPMETLNLFGLGSSQSKRGLSTSGNDKNEDSEETISTSTSKINNKGTKKLIDRIKRPLKKVRFSQFVDPNQKDSLSFHSLITANTENKEQAISNKQNQKRKKRLRRNLRLLLPRAPMERTTKIEDEKHFRSLKNKKKRVKRFRGFIYKLQEQYSPRRDIKKRDSTLSAFNDQGVTSGEGGSLFLTAPAASDQLGAQGSDELIIQERAEQPTEYPENKNSILRDLQQDFHFIFRLQMGEGLDFAQEEIRARIFVNPYIRFLLRNRIDALLSRSASVPQVQGTPQAYKDTQISPSLNKGFNQASSSISKNLAENDLFKRRLMIAKYADTVDFLKPSLLHSYVDKAYNHQFKGTLATARRLFSLKVQYDQPLINSLSYTTLIWHEGLSSTRSKGTQAAELSQHWTDPDTEVADTEVADTEGADTEVADTEGADTEGDSTSSWLQSRSLGQEEQRFLENNYSAPLYAAWAPELRKFILTNRYLDYKTITTSALVTTQATTPTNNRIQFTHWPLKESYSKNQLGDSFLSKTYENLSPAALPRRVTSFNRPLGSKNILQPTDAQRSQQFLNIEQNDKKTFLFKDSWNPSDTADELNELTDKNSLNDLSFNDTGSAAKADSGSAVKEQKSYIPASAVQGSISGRDGLKDPLWMLLRALPPNQGGFLWPGD